MVTTLQGKQGLGAFFGQGMIEGQAQQQEQNKAALVQSMKGEEKRRSVLAQMMLSSGDTQGAMNLMAQPSRMPQQGGGFFGGLMNRLFGGGDSGQQQAAPQMQQAPTAPAAPRETAAAPVDKPPHTEEAIKAMGALNPAVQAHMIKQNEDWVAEKRHKEEMGFKERKVYQEETRKYREDIAAKGTGAQAGLENKEKLMGLIEKGNLDDPTFVAAVNLIPGKLGERFLSPDTVTYRSALFNEFGDLKQKFTGTTRVIEIEKMEEKLPNLYLTNNQKRGILKSRAEDLQSDILRAQVAGQVESEGKNLGTIAFPQEVEKRLRPLIQTERNKMLDNISSVINLAEKRKKAGPLDPTNAEDKEILEQILKEAGGDNKKAAQIATKMGYKF